MSLPKAKRIAVKQTLSRYQLFVGRVDENWSPGTERALRRGAEEVAKRSQLMYRPRLVSQREAQVYIAKLESGEFGDYFQKESDAQLWSFLNVFKGG
ncbi:hypothetical protein [Thioclava sp. GXIMD4216]